MNISKSSQTRFIYRFSIINSKKFLNKTNQKYKNMNVNKSGLVDKVHQALQGTKVEAEKAVDTVVNSIIETLKSGDEVSIAGLGIFSTKMRAARQARNPRTGEPIQVPAMRVPKFRAAKALKEAVRG